MRRDADVKMVDKMVDEEQPKFVLGSPPCDAFSELNVKLNFPRMDVKKVKARIAEGKRHLHTCVKLYHKQHDAGRFFLHKHPATAKSWEDDEELPPVPQDGAVVEWRDR